VVNTAIHRAIENQGAARPDAIAIVDGSRSLTYRELNLRANNLARHLIRCGFTRGATAIVKMERSTELAVTLLAILKAGGAYAWARPGSAAALHLPAPFCIAQRGRSIERGSEQRFLALDLSGALAACADRPSPNLPILTRGSDVACVLPGEDGAPQMLVPHETVTALTAASSPGRTRWSSDAAAFDLWLTLMSGATVTLAEEPVLTAA
jgi:non-ribosomal peptide synthetase component F